MMRTKASRIRFGAVVWRRRLALTPGISLRAFAAACDVSPTFVSRMETGEFEAPSPKSIARMATVLGCSKDERRELFRLAEKLDPDLVAALVGGPPALDDFVRATREHVFTDDEIALAMRTILGAR